MFKKVLIAEDHESISISVQKTLSDFNIAHNKCDYAYYCDDALSRIKKAIRQEQPYDLLITDLSFNEDVPQLISGGSELIKTVKQIQPDLKILVFSVENRSVIANSLIRDLDIDAFVPKGRQDIKDLKNAIEAIANNKKYVSNNLKKASEEERYFNFTSLDKKIILLLSEGIPQKDIPVYLKKENIKPSSLSTVEKHLSEMKTALNISKNEQLIAYCKDIKII